MSKIKLTGENSGYVELSAGQNAGNNTLEAPTSGTRLVAHEGTQDVVLGGNLTVNGALTYEDVTSIDSVGIITARSGIHVTGGSVGIGTDNPVQKLDVIGGNVRVGKTSNGKYIAENNLGQSKVVIDSSGTSYLNGGNVGIGTDNPNSRQLSVYGPGVNGAQIECRATGGNSSGLSMYAGRNFEIQSTTSVEANYPDSFIVYDRGANGYRMAIDGSGRVRTPNQPRFFAWSETTQSVSSNGWTKATLWTQTRFNVGSHFSTATDYFTVPIAGCYLFGTTVRLDGIGGGYSRVIISINDSNLYGQQGHSITDSAGSTTDSYHTQAVTALYELSANDTVSIRVYSDLDASYNIHSESQFWGYLVA